MSRRFWTGLMAGILLAGLLGVGGVRAQGNSGDHGKGKPKVDFPQDKTPLEKGIEAAVERRRGNGKAVPQIHSRKLDETECPTCGDVMGPGGRKIGRRIKTKTTLDFDQPGQRKDGATKWDPVVFQKRQVGNVGHGGFNPRGLDIATSNGGRVRSSALFPDASSNDDRDCIDTVTGDRLGGLDGTGQPVPDGDPSSCFDDTGHLKRTLVEVTGGCMHEGSGTFLDGDPTDGFDDHCYDADGLLKTSLEELIDEDGPEVVDDDGDGLIDEDPAGDADGDGNPNDDADCLDAAGTILRGPDCFDGGVLREGLAELVDEDGPDPIDQDADGFADEDPADPDLDDACRNFGVARGLPPGLGNVQGDQCDLTRAVIVQANQDAMRDYGKKIFKADDDGNYDPNSDGAVEYGSERRRFELVETLGIRCEKGELVDGECVVENQASSASPGAALERALAARETLDAGGTVKEYAMMGFTVAPPVLEWGYRIEEYACVDLGLLGEVCVEVFFARVGYEFDTAVGLRLPVEVEVSEIPDPAALAGDEMTLQAKVQPVDFTAKQYEDFCEKHHLDDGLIIGSCKRFSFPNWFDTLNPFLSEEEVDGDEFVARMVVFAGVIVRVAQIPVITWGIDSAVDLPTMCTFDNIRKKLQDLDIDLLNFGFDLAKDGDIRRVLKNELNDCASFTTPFGKEPDPANPLLDRLRTFPINKSFSVRADCVEALARGETVTIKKKTRPICTGLLLGYNGASLGIGLGLDVAAGSDLIEAAWNASGDAAPGAGSDQEVQFRHAANEGEDPVEVGPVRLDNLDGRPFADTGVVDLGDWTYYLNTLQFSLSASLQFGGILTPIPDLASMTIYNFQFSVGDLGIPIGQHNGTEDLEIPIFVKNHALAVDVQPASTDPEVRTGPDTLKVRPGEFGDYLVSTTNLGNVVGDFDDFRFELSNRPNQSPPYVFGIDPNTDHDCTDGAGGHFRGDPYDSVADDCYLADGTVRGDRVELIDEDPPGPAGAPSDVRDEDGDGLVDEDPVDVWTAVPDAAGFALAHIDGVGPYSDSAPQSLVLSVSPFRHPLTAPGLYPVRVTADSREARELGLAGIDPSGNHRLDATDVTFVQVDSFFDPRVQVEPAAASGRAGVGKTYSVDGTNFGNDTDSMQVQVQFVDSNQTGCDLADLGNAETCPYRSFPTVIQAEWTDVSDLAEMFGPLGPLEVESDELNVVVPADWAGIEDVTYQFVVTVTSLGDTAEPAAKNRFVVEQTVEATPESKSRYIGLEVSKLIDEIEAANEEGINTAGLLPILMYPVRMNSDKAVASAAAGDAAGAVRAHQTSIRIMQGFLYSLNGFGGKLPAERESDWRRRADAILADLQVAAAG